VGNLGFKLLAVLLLTAGIALADGFNLGVVSNTHGNLGGNLGLFWGEYSVGLTTGKIDAVTGNYSGIYFSETQATKIYGDLVLRHDASSAVCFFPQQDRLGLLAETHLGLSWRFLGAYFGRSEAAYYRGEKQGTGVWTFGAYFEYNFPARK
jgi:hypothetical protein